MTDNNTNDDKTCKKCNHICHCSGECCEDCTNCECNSSQAQDLTYENNG